jgi:hypothetical protein
MKMRIVTCFVLVFSLLGCAAQKVENPPIKKPAKELKSSDLQARPEWFACEVDTDCEVVQLSCCDACNGGTEIVINKKSTSAAKEAWSEECSSHPGCTERDCEDFTAVCLEKVCTPKQGDRISSNPVLR